MVRKLTTEELENINLDLDVPDGADDDDDDEDTPEDEFECPVCDRTFEQESALKRHVTRKHPDYEEDGEDEDEDEDTEPEKLQVSRLLDDLDEDDDDDDESEPTPEPEPEPAPKKRRTSKAKVDPEKAKAWYNKPEGTTPVEKSTEGDEKVLGSLTKNEVDAARDEALDRLNNRPKPEDISGTLEVISGEANARDMDGEIGFLRADPVAYMNIDLKIQLGGDPKMVAAQLNRIAKALEE